MANRVDIDIFANDKTGGTLNDIKGKFSDLEGGFESLTGISLTTAGVMAAIGGGISAAVEFTKDAIEETIKYNDQITTLARNTGLSLDDASRLIQVAKDMGIEYKDLATGLGNATKKGVDVSIESLLDLGDEYKKLETPIDRAKWLTEHFGAAGEDIAPIFEAMRSDVVEDLDAVSDALAWDDEKQKAVDDYEQGMADVKKSFEDLKIEVTMGVLPALQAVLDVMNNKEGSRGEGYKRMLRDVKTDAWAATGALKDLWSWMQKIAGGPSGGTVTSGAAVGIGGKGYTAPNPYSIPRATGGWDVTGGGPGGANGLDFIVPPGYRNDSFPFRAESGERVQVTPKNQMGGDFDYDRLGRVIVESLERSSLVR